MSIGWVRHLLHLRWGRMLFALGSASVAVAFLIWLGHTTHAQTIFPEIPTTPGGFIQEIHMDDQGRMWTGDYETNEIWRIDPATQEYLKISGLSGGVVEAQIGPDGALWYSGFDNGSLGRVDLNAGTVVTWTIPGSSRPWGMTFDANNDLWISEYDVAKIYRYTAGTNQLCTYIMPNETKSLYLRADNRGVWLGDYSNDRIARIESTPGGAPQEYQLVSWPLQTQNSGAYPYEIDIDGQGNVWWGEFGLAAIGRLDPAGNQFSLYPHPDLSGIIYIALAGSGPAGPDSVWFTDNSFRRLGGFKPEYLLPIQYTVTPTTTALTASCVPLGNGQSAPVAQITSGNAAVNTEVTDPDLSSCGWLKQSLPAGSIPYDIVVVDDRLWFTDFERERLVSTPSGYMDQISECRYSFLPMLSR